MADISAACAYEAVLHRQRLEARKRAGIAILRHTRSASAPKVGKSSQFGRSGYHQSLEWGELISTRSVERDGSNDEVY